MIFRSPCLVSTSLCYLLLRKSWLIACWIFFLAECFKFLSVDVALEREAEGDLLLADMGQV